MRHARRARWLAMDRCRGAVGLSLPLLACAARYRSGDRMIDWQALFTFNARQFGGKGAPFASSDGRAAMIVLANWPWLPQERPGLRGAA